MVDYLLDVGPVAATMSAKEIAAAVGTSDATVVRTARTLGYDSLRDLRRSLAGEESQVDLVGRLDATISSMAEAGDTFAPAIERHLRAVDTLVRAVSSDDFDAATAVLAAADQVWWSGVGPSAHLAEYAAFVSRRLGRRGGALTHSGTDHADELLAVGPGDAVVAFAYGRLHSYVNVLLDRAQQVDVPVVLITDRTSTDATPDNVAVRLKAGRGTPGLFASHAPTIVLIEALALAVAATDQERADRSLRELNQLRRALAGRRLDVDPS
ncbi:MAG: transcriptional regulator [Acidimicrobiales bacterium]|nr:transcriptional regulator [Acidimicrobiales bacterium]